MNNITIMRFKRFLGFTNYNHDGVQAGCVDLETGKNIKLTFGRGSILYPRICKLRAKPPFTEVVRYDETFRNDVRVVNKKQKQKYKDLYPEEFV